MCLYPWGREYGARSLVYLTVTKWSRGCTVLYYRWIETSRNPARAALSRILECLQRSMSVHNLQNLFLKFETPCGTQATSFCPPSCIAPCCKSTQFVHRFAYENRTTIRNHPKRHFRMTLLTAMSCSLTNAEYSR